MTSTSSFQSASPVRVSGTRWFYVCYGGHKGRAAPEDSFIVQTYSELRTLLARGADANAEPVLYICSKAEGGRTVFRRVMWVRKVLYTDTRAFELEDGQIVVWVEGKFGDSAHIELDVPVGIGQLASSANTTGVKRWENKEA